MIPERHEKAVFIEASQRARQSLSQWLIQAGLERAERQGLDRAVEVVRDFISADITRRPPVDDAEATRLYIEQLAHSVRCFRSPGERPKVLSIICSEVTRPLAEASFDGPIHVDETKPPGAMAVVPRGYAESISCSIGFVNPTTEAGT